MSHETQSKALQEAIAVLGGPVSAAKLLGVPGGRYQTVQGWLKCRVPADYCPLIEEQTALRGRRIICERLRPDIRWGVLRGADQAANDAQMIGAA